jgi:predicted Zn-dependent protease with MMP-like domain
MVEVDRYRFAEMVEQAVDGLPPDLAALLRNVGIVIADRSDDPRLLGLYEGIPLTERSSDYSAALPDRITIYREAICAYCATESDVVVEVRRTVVHEVGHHFGIDDDRLHELGW